MNFDFGEVLTSAGKITWKNKSLWWFGIFLGFFVLIIFLFAFIPISIPIFLRAQRMDLFFLAMAGFFIVFVVFFLVIYVASVLFQTATTLGVLRASQDEEPIPLIQLIKNSMPFFWRVLGVMALYTSALMIVNLILQMVLLVLVVATLGIGMLCTTPLIMLQYPLTFVAAAWLEQSVNGVIVDNMNIMDAVKQGWQIIRNNLLAMGLVMIVVYLGIGIVSMIVMMPMLAPLFFVPLVVLRSDLNWMVLAITLLCVGISAPLFAVLSGWSMVFTKSTWVLTYLCLTRPTPSSMSVDA
jgi:hypothetical protein